MALDGYITFTTTRADNRNDGIIVSERLDVGCDELELGGVHGLDLKFTLNCKPFNLTAIYLTHDTHLDLFTNALNWHYNHIVNGTTYIFAGNVNANILRPGNKTDDTWTLCMK